MARQGGCVQLEQSDMLLALNMAKMAKRGFLRTTRAETQYLIKKPCAEVREENKQGVEFRGHNKMKAAIERHPAMLRQNHSAGCLSWQNRTVKNPQTHWKRKGTDAPPPNWRREPTLEPTPALHGIPPTPSGNISGAQSSQISILPAGYTYSHSSLPCAESVFVNAPAQDNQNDTDFNPDMLTDQITATDYYTVSCVVMQVTFILMTRAACWVILVVMTSIDRMARPFGDYYYTEFADTVRNIW